MRPLGHLPCLGWWGAGQGPFTTSTQKVTAELGGSHHSLLVLGPTLPGSGDTGGPSLKVLHQCPLDPSPACLPLPLGKPLWGRWPDSQPEVSDEAGLTEWSHWPSQVPGDLWWTLGPRGVQTLSLIFPGAESTFLAFLSCSPHSDQA